MESQKVLVLKVSITDVPGFPPLPKLHQEILAISSRGHQVNEMAEPLRRRDILRAILDNDPFDIIHFAGHLCEDGFVASEEIIPLDMIVMYIQTGRPKLAFFNTCSSEKVAELVASRCPSDCIFTIANIDNDDAIDFCTMFYSVLRSPDINSYKDARDRVDSTGTLFRYLPGKDVIVRRGDEVTQRLDALERAVGGGRLGEVGLAQRMQATEGDVRTLKDWVQDEAKPTLALVRREYREPKSSDRYLWVIFLVGLFISIGLAVLLMRAQ